MPRTPFPNSWRGENGLYVVGLTRSGLHGTALDAIKIAEHIVALWTTEECQKNLEIPVLP